MIPDSYAVRDVLRPEQHMQNATSHIETSGDQAVVCEAFAGSLSSATAVSAQASAMKTAFEDMCTLRLDSKPLTDVVNRISVAIASVRALYQPARFVVTSVHSLAFSLM